MEDINEMIKTVKDEEEQERNTNWGETLRQLKDTEEKGRDSKVTITLTEEGRDSKVTITLDEYLVLKAKEMDLDRILRSIVGALTLSYNSEFLSIRESGGIVDAFRVLFPEAYEKIYEEQIDKYTQENKEGE